MQDASTNNKRIAKNTLMLYFRMLLIMGVTLYTSRIILEQLGVIDYGVYNVVAGVVAMFGFLNGSISTATQRFLAIKIIENNNGALSRIFQTIQSIHLIIAVIVLILAETVGLWFIYNYINVPPNSFSAALYVYQASIAVAIVGIIMVPYISLAIAHEHMKIYSYLSIMEAFLKLSVAVLLVWIHFEKLILYASLVFISTLLTYITWIIITKRKYSFINLRPIYYREIGNKIFKFIGWQTFGSFAFILRTQGINILLNIFFGPVLNAARGIAVQVNTAMLQFIQNFQMAVIPQINKQYASKNLHDVNALILSSSKISFLLMFILSVPVLLETRQILEIWLKDVPDYGVLFVQLIIITTLTDLLSGTLVYGALATGEIKRYQIVLSSIYLFTLPIVYLCYKTGLPPQTLFYVDMSLNLICLIVRLLFLNKMTGLRIMDYMSKVLFPEVSVMIISLLFAFIIKLFLDPNSNNGILILIISFLSVIVLSFFIGFNKTERNWIFAIVKNKILK